MTTTSRLPAAAHRRCLPRRTPFRGRLALFLSLLVMLLASAAPAPGQLTLKPSVYQAIVAAAPVAFVFLTPPEIEALKALRVAPGNRSTTFYSGADVISIYNAGELGLTPGEALFVVKLQGKVKLPNRNIFRGRVAHFTARLRVDAVSGKDVRASVVRASEELAVDDLVVRLAPGRPLPLPSRLLSRKRPARQGRIIAAMRDTQLFAEGSIVLLDVGAADGLHPGMELPVVTWLNVRVQEPAGGFGQRLRQILRRDRRMSSLVRRARLPLGAKRSQPHWSPGTLLRKVSLGSLRATLVRERFSTAVLTRIVEDIRIGDLVELPGAP